MPANRYSSGIVHHLDAETGDTYCGQSVKLVEKSTTTLMLVNCRACQRVYYDLVAMSRVTIEDFL